jgi:hypothetical protein
MNNKIIIGIIVAIAVIAGGAYVVTRNGGTALPGQSNRSDQADLTLKALLEAGRPVKCAFHDLDAKTDGTMYVASGKMRGDFDSNAAGRMMKTHMVVEGNTSYMWIDGESTGFKTTFDLNKNGNNNVNGNAPQGIDAGKKLDYRCDPWSVDQKEFERPSDVKFNDMSEMMKGIVPQGANINGGVRANVNAGANAAQCAACDSVPESSRAQCKTALGCN